MDSLDNLLNFDPLAHAEKVTGNSYKEDPDTTMLGMLMAFDRNDKLKEELSSRNDTHFGIGFDEALEIALAQGFEIVYKEEFPDGKEYTEGTSRFFILWRSGVLLTIESYGEKTLNTMKMYYNWNPHTREGSRLRSSGSIFESSLGEWTVSGHHDVREGFIHHLSNLEENGTFLPVWEDNPFLWLVNYSEASNDYKEIKLRKMAQFPQHVKDALKVSMDAS